MVVDFIYGDSLPSPFEGLLEALDAAKELKFVSMVDHCHREVKKKKTNKKVNEKE